MRSLAVIALLGSCVAPGLFAQSLTEHAAAAAGATIGTAAGKPLGTAMGRIFGEVDKTTSTATVTKTSKPAAAKPTPSKPPEAEKTAHTSAGSAPHGVGVGDTGGGDGGGGSYYRHVSHRNEFPAEAEAAPSAPLLPVIVPAAPQPTAADVAGVRVGSWSNQLPHSLGTAESTVSIPDDDGHLVEIRQYWSNGEPVGTIRIDNGRVVSVQTNN